MGAYVLAGPEGRHAATVRRLGAGESLELVDGVGGVALAIVTGPAGRDRLGVQVSEVRLDPAPAPRLTVVQALAKGDRGELAVELLTEVGVDVIVPWAAERSIARWDGERGAKGLARWRRTAAEASKQSRRAWWPQVREVADTAAVAELLRSADLGVVLHEESPTTLAAIGGSGPDIVLVVGPEGGIGPEELGRLGGLAVRLGPTVLRTSTAGVVAAGVLLARSPRWV